MVTPAPGLKTKDIWTESMKAGEDLTGKQYYFLANSSETAVVATAEGIVVGVAQTAPASDSVEPTSFHVKLMKIGRTPVVCGAAITKDTFITNNSSGKAVTATETDVVHGVARSTTTADGQIVWVDLNINTSTYLIADAG